MFSVRIRATTKPGTAASRINQLLQAVKNLSKPANCANCPCAWEDMSYEGECYDCGCIASKHMNGSSPVCRLPLPIRRWIRKRADIQESKRAAREYENIIAYAELSDKKDQAMLHALQHVLNDETIDREKAYDIRIKYEDCLEQLQQD